MSHPDADASDGRTDHIDDRILQQEEFAAALNAQGYTDLLVLRRENGEDVLTDRRVELLDHVARESVDVTSVSDLARQLNRDKGAVSKDLTRLAELDVIEYEGEGNGDAKRPTLKHDHVVIEPVVY